MFATRSFDPFVTMLLYDKETLVYKEIVSMLRSNKQREWMMKRGAFQDGLAVSERPRRWKKKSKQVGQRQFQKGSKEARCFKYSEAGHFKRVSALEKVQGRRKERLGFSRFSCVSKKLVEILMASEMPVGCGGSKAASIESRSAKDSKRQQW